MEDESVDAAAGPQVGDEVMYFPHTLYAKEQSGSPRNPRYPWQFGWTQSVPDPDNPRKANVEVQELTHKQLQLKLDWLARHSDPAMERRRLVPMRPLDAWPGRVTAVNGDGTVDIAVVTGTRSGVELNMPGVKLVEHSHAAKLRAATRDAGAQHPACALAHTCHLKETA